MTDSSSELFDIVFRGDILPGHQLPVVKQKLMQLFKIDEARVHALFTSGAVPLKRNLPRDAAEKYQKVLAAAGASVQVAPAGSVKPRPQRPVERPASSASPAASAKPAPPVKPQKPQSLAERLAALEADKAAETPAASPSIFTSRDVASDSSAPVSPAPQSATATSSTAEGSFSLAPVGADVLAPEERSQQQAVDVDTSALSLRAAEGNLLDATELLQVDDVEVNIDGITLAEVGGDLLTDEERYQLPIPEIDVPEVELAPVGSDLGQIKPPPAPAAPDTSSLSIVADDSSR